MRRWLVLTAAVFACLPCATGLAQASPGARTTQAATHPAPTTTPMTTPTTRPAPSTGPVQAATQPASAPVPKPVPRGEQTVKFQFAGIPYGDAVRWFAQNAGKPILGDVAISGELTFFDNTPYSYSDALDTLNLLLAMKGFWLIETDRYFRVVPVSQVPNETKILPGLAEMETVRPGEVVTVVIPLQQVDSETAAKAVVRMVSTWGSISALSKGKGVVITDSVKNIRRIQDFLQIYDAKSTADTAIESCTLKRANARVVVDIINKLFTGAQKRSYERNRETGRFELVRQDTSDDTVSATADERTNSVILMGRSDRIAMAREMVNKLDAGGDEEAGDIRVFLLKNAKAEELAKVLLQAVEGSSRSSYYSSSSESNHYRPSSDTSSSTPLRIVPDPATNRLIVSAPADKMAAIEKLILQLDTASTAAGAARIVRLKSSDAQQLAEVVTSVLTTRGSYGRAASGVQVAADTRTNSLILNGAAGEVQTALKLIEDLDTENATETREVRVIQLKAGNAAQIAASLLAMFSSEVRGSYGERTSRSTIRVEADAASNTLLISAPTAQWPKVQKLLEQLTAAAEAAPVAVTRRYVLKDAKADDVGRILREIHGQSSSRSYGEYSGYSSRYGRSSQSAAATVPVTVAADRNSNTLIVSACEKDHAAIAEMIKALDVPPAAQGDPVRIVTLESADAARLAQTLQAMLPPTPYGQKPEISIQADPATNTLLIRAPESQRKMLEEMIASLDKQTKANASETRTFRLKFAKASDIADVLRQMLADDGAPSRSQYGYSRYSSYSSSSPASSPAGSLRVVALQEGNAVVVQGSPAKLAQAEKLIATFDTPEAARDVAIVRIPLTKARAETLVETIRNMLPTAQQGREQEVYIEAEKATNSILLRAPEAQRTTLQTIITQLDSDAADLTREVRIIAVKRASAAALAIMFERLYPQTQASPYSYGSSSGYGYRRSRSSSSSSDDSVIITAAPGDKALVVEAPKTKIDSIARLIASLDVENAPGSIEIRTYQIANSKAADLADSLRKLFAARAGDSGYGRSSVAGQTEPRFEADAATNQLMAAATAGQFEEIEKVIQKLQAATVLATQTKAFVLKHARAEDISAVLETMLAEAGGASRRSYDPYSSYSRRSSSDASAVRVAAVPAANTIVVQGPPEKIALAEKLIAGFDTPEASGQATVRVVPLANADASTLAALLTKMLPPAPAGKEQQVTIQADPLTNTVLLRAPEAQRKMIEDLIARLDKDAPAQVREMRIIPVRFVSASALAEKLIQVFPSPSSAASSAGAGYDSGYGSYSRYGRTRTVTPGGDDAKRVVITAAPGDKALIIDAPKAKIDEIVATVAKLDVEDAPSRQQVRVYQLAGSKAADVAASLAKIFAQPRQQGTGGQGAPAAPEPRFEADAATNQLMAAATAEQFVEIEKVITQVQKAVGLASQTRCFPLKNARAADLAEMLQTMLGDSSSQSASEVPWWARRSSGSSSAPAVRVAAMAGANTLVVQAPPDKMLLAEQLIAQFDTDKAERQIVIEIVRLANAQAPSLADAVNAALAARRPTASRYGSGSSSPSAAQEPQVTVTAEVNSNSILVRGPAGEVKGVVDMIKRLDQQGTSSQVQVRVFKLENSSATDIAKSVGQLFVDMTRQRSYRGGSGERAVEPAPFSVAADERTNSLVVSTTPINFQIVQEILAQLDKAGTPREVGYFYLDRADPFELAAKLDAMYADRPAATKPVIEADDISRLVSVVAKEADLKAIEEVIAKLDTPTAADRQPIVRVVPVSRISASRMAELLQKMYGQMGNAEIVVADKLPVRDANSQDANSVRIFPAPPTDMDMIYTRIEMPPLPAGSGPAATQPATRPTTQPAPSADSGQGQVEAHRAKITIAVDRNSNSLVVLAPRQELEGIQSLMDQLSASAADADMELRVIRVEHASPSAVADTLDALFNPRSRGSAQSQIMQAISGRSSQGGRGGRGAPPQPEAPPAPVAQSPLTVVADVRTRSIVVRAKPSDFDMILPLVKELDRVSTVTSEVRIFTLKNTDATEVAANLTELFKPKRQTPESPFSPFSRSRSGSSSSSWQQTQMILELLQMSGEGGEVGATKVDSSSLLSISANKGTNSVIVSAPTDAMKLIQKVIEEIDKSTSFSRAVRMYPLKHAEVAPTVQALREIFADTGSSRRVSSTGRPGSFGTPGAPGGAGASGMSEPIIVTGNEAGRVILVSAPDEKHELVAKVIKDLDDSQATGEITVKVYRLENADAASLSTALAGALQFGGAVGGPAGRTRGGSSAGAGAAAGQLRISADPSSNSLVIRASKEDHARITQLLGELDTAQTDRYPVRAIALKHADAESVSRTLGGLFGGASAGGAAPGRTSTVRTRTGPSAGAGGKGGVVIEPDAASRMILVRADDETFAKIQEVVAKLDVDSAEKYPVQTIALNNANAADIAAVLNAVFGGQGAGASASAARRAAVPRTTAGPAAGSGAVTIEADPGARMLLVRANQDTFEKIRELAAKLDLASTGSSARTLLTLKHAKAEMVAASLSQAFSAAAGQRGGASRTNPEDVVSIVPEPGTNSIIVTANAPNLERVKSLLAQLDVESAGMRTELLLLKYAKAADLAPVLAQSAAAGGQQPGGRGKTSSSSGGAATGQGVTISADSASNALVITGATGQIDKIIQMAMQLDRASETSSTTVKVIQLKNGNASAVAAMIRDMYAQQRQAAQAARQTVAPMAVTADERANAVVVSTNAEMHENVAKWISEIEAMKPSRGTMRLIQLKNVDPAEVDRAIQQLYNTPGTRGPAGAQAPVGKAGAARPPAGAAAGGGRVETSVLDQQRSILINASDEDFEAIQALAKALDEAAAATRQSVQVFVLTNANNTRVAAALTSMYRPSAGRAGAAPRPEDQVTVTALAMTNAVVVSAAKEKMAEVAHLIEQLDKKEVAPQLEFRIYALENEMPTKIMPALQQLLTQIKKLRPEETIDVQADERTRSIIVTAKGTVFEQIEKLIKTLDKPPANSAADVRVIPLKRADATRLAAVLMEMIRPSAQNQVTPEARSLQDQIRLLRLRGGSDKDLPDLDLGKPIKITADPVLEGQQGSNSLVIVSTGDNLKALAAIVETLDAVPLAEAAKVRLLHLANADAATVAKILVDVFAQGAKLAGQPKSSVAGRAVPESVSGKALVNPLNVSPDPRTNTLVLSGLEESLALAEIIVKQLDVQTTVDMHDVRLLTLKNADSLTLAPILQKMLDARVQRAAALGQLDAERLRMLVAADTRSNSLIVAGSIDGFALVKSLAEQLDAAGPALGGEIQILPLKHANAGTLSVTLVNLFNARYEAARTPDVARQKPVILPDLRINALLVSAIADDSKVLAGLVGKMDVEITDPAVVLEVLPLAHNDAGVIGPTIQQLFQARLTSMTPPGTPPAPQDRVDVAADALANALIISASRENLAMIRGLLKKVDVEPPVESGVVKIYPLVRADAQKAATMLQGLVQQGLYKPGASFAAQTNPAVAAREKVAISVDARTNSLIVSASRENLAILDQIIRGIDGEQVVPATEFRVFKLTSATATVIAPTLQQLFTQRVSREATKDPMTVIPDARSNSLIVGASPADMKLAETLIAQLDAPQGKGSTMVAFPLKKADATQVANTLKTLLAGQGVTGAPAAGAANISVDERTNTILVSAGAADLQRVKELVDQLDREQLTNVTEIRVFPLQHADATELSQILTSLLTNKPLSPVALSPNRQTLLQFISKTEDGKELIATALQEGVLIAPDRRSNAVVVAAPVKNMPLLESLVRSMDSISPRMAEIRVFTLVNADAQRMSDVLSQLFRLQGAQQAAKAVSYTLATTQPAASADRGPTATVGNSEQDALSVTVDLRTNSLLIGGTKRYVELASKVIQDLDSSPAQERLTKVYRLRNAQAKAIQTAMQSFLDQEKQRLTSTLGTGGMGAAQRMLEREVAVVAEETSNVLLLSASPRYFATIEALIKELDQPPPQVLIQVLLAEVKLDETNELGIDWNVTTKWNKDRESVGAGTQFALAAQGDGFNLSVAAGDLSFFLRALQSQGRLEVLSRPQILASDNQKATINVGQRVPFITNSRTTENNTTINTIEYQNVGIILTVTPRINPDGFVKLEVKPEISSMAQAPVFISEKTPAVVINQRSAETTVSVQDGHTIILGGLITTKDDRSEQRVPWLGDWPLLGAMFRGTSLVKERSELLIILTPHVLRTIPDADEMADAQIDRVNRIRKLKREEVEDYLKKHLDELLAQKALKDRFGGQFPTTQPATRPATEPVRLPALQPLTVPMEPLPSPASGANMPLPHRPDESADVSDASWQRAQEQFLAAMSAGGMWPESTR
jgi:type II secretory pathway component GspD/PulD (secretin)